MIFFYVQIGNESVTTINCHSSEGGNFNIAHLLLLLLLLL
jgi:hypothetical protein